MKILSLKLLIFLMAINITMSGCSIWDPIFRPNHERERRDGHKGDHDRKGDRDHKGDHDRRDDHVFSQIQNFLFISHPSAKLDSNESLRTSDI